VTDRTRAQWSHIFCYQRTSSCFLSTAPLPPDFTPALAEFHPSFYHAGREQSQAATSEVLLCIQTTDYTWLRPTEAKQRHLDDLEKFRQGVQSMWQVRLACISEKLCPQLITEVYLRIPPALGFTSREDKQKPFLLCRKLICDPLFDAICSVLSTAFETLC